ncbi:MAG: hypothetical protein GY866_37275 [Proteobacteria bacterium]|nr:hypothetical protein [Pseudomonadota bacterium]
MNEQRDSILLCILKTILMYYDDLICERLNNTRKYPSKARKGLGHHKRKGDGKDRFCRGRKAAKSDYRQALRKIDTVFGKPVFKIRVVKCLNCGRKYSPLLDALGIERYSQKEGNFENEVIEAVIDTNYRRLIDGRSIDITLGGIHNIVVGSDIDKAYEEPVPVDDLKAVMADGTKVKQAKGEKGELRSVIGIDREGRVQPLGCFTNTGWKEIETKVKERLTTTDESPEVLFVYDGEPGLDRFLADIAESRRCTWHGSRGLYHPLWEDGLKKKQSQPETDKLSQIIGMELPTEDINLIEPKGMEELILKYEDSKTELSRLIETFREKGYKQGTAYLENLAKGLFTNIEIRLRTGVIAPKVTSLLERTFRELGGRLKRIAWGWTDKAVTNLSNMIMMRQYSREKWEEYWKEKLGIKNCFKIDICGIKIL